MSKHSVLMRDVICRYHPEFRKSRDLREYGIKHADIFNVERLVEECLAALGPYFFVDQPGYDFTDFSDSKTTTVNINTRVGSINGVENKIGALRVTSYNPHKDCLDYFFVSKRDLEHVKMPCYGVNSHKERILFSWTAKNDHYNSFEDFRVNDFKTLACAM